MEAPLITFVAVALSALPVLAQPPGPRTINVSGHAEISAAPDRAEISLAVETEAAAAGPAVAENAARSAKLVDALKKLVGEGDRVTTSGYSLQPRYNIIKPGDSGEPRIVGYTARNAVLVETGKIASVGTLIDAAIAAGANRINDLRFTLADRAPHLRSALEQAGKEAHAQAESIARALGVALKGVLSASSSASPMPMKRFEAMGMAAMRVQDTATPIEAGDVTVSADVQVTYEIAD